MSYQSVTRLTLFTTFRTVRRTAHHTHINGYTEEHLEQLGFFASTSYLVQFHPRLLTTSFLINSASFRPIRIQFNFNLMTNSLTLRLLDF
jgi:hypothetical protein